MASHSKIGASSCERWWNCPGSVSAVEALPPQPDSPYALEGTKAHALAEFCLKKGLDTNSIGPEGLKSNGWDEEMAEHVQMYLDVIREDMKKYGVHRSDLKIEHKFHLAHIDKDAFGTNDANLPVFLTKLIVYDFKYGAGVAVDATENKQLLYYALGAAYGEVFEEIEVVVVQPRAIHKAGPVRRWIIKAAELRDFASELKARIAETRKPNAKRVCGDHCKKTFCPAMPTCPEVRKQVEEAAMVAFDEPMEISFPKPDDLKPEQLRRILDAIPLLETWMKSVWAYAETKADNGEKIPGYKLVKGREGNRKWSDEGRVSVALEAFGDQIYNYSLKSPSQMEKQIGKDHVKKLHELITRSEGKNQLVPESDPREEVAAQIENVFSNIEQEDLFR